MSARKTLKATPPAHGRVPIAWLRDPVGMSRDERVAEVAQVLAIGLGRLQLHGEIVRKSVDDRTPVEPLCANAPVNSRARGVAR